MFKMSSPIILNHCLKSVCILTMFEHLKNTLHGSLVLSLPRMLARTVLWQTGRKRH